MFKIFYTLFTKWLL